MSNKKDLNIECIEIIIWLNKIVNEAVKLDPQTMIDEIIDSNRKLAIILEAMVESADDPTKVDLIIMTVYVIDKALKSNLLSK